MSKKTSAKPQSPGSLHPMVWRLVSWNTRSESPQDFCEQCHDTGFAGDNGPGGCGSWNNEYAACDCDPVARLRRQQAREVLKSDNAPADQRPGSPDAEQT